MKKLIFGLVATVVLGFNGYANNNIDRIKKSVNDDLLRPKNGWYYAGVDAAGGYAGFQAGAATLHPLLMSAGMVFGAIGSSAWEWYWDHKSAPIKLNNPKDPFAKTFTNQSEQGGYLHNLFIINFINENQVTFESTDEFVDKIYVPLCQEISNEYKIELETVMKSFPKENMIKELEKFNKLHSTDDDNERVSILGKIVEETAGSSTFNEYYSSVMNSFRLEEAKSDFQIKSFIDGEILKLASDNKLTCDEKTVIINSLNILKYSYALWSNN